MLDLLYPLSEFFHPGEPIPLAEQEVQGQRMPEPYRSLLVHDTDMTSTLEAFHGESLTLRLLEVQRRDEDLFRQVVLVGETSGRGVEFGAIRIDLTRFEPQPRQEIVEGRRPLGSILARHRVAYTSRPRLFFHLDADVRVAELLGLSETGRLYGRQNVLWDPSGVPLAEVVEILPP